MVDEASQTTPRTVVRREVLRFAIPGAIGVVLLVTASLVAAVAVAREQSVQDAHTAAQWLVRTVVEPRIDEGLKTGSPARMAELDAAFSASISGSGRTFVARKTRSNCRIPDGYGAIAFARMARSHRKSSTSYVTASKWMA